MIGANYHDLEIDEYNYMFHNILNVHNTISKNYNMINNGLHNLHRKLETRHPLKTGLRSDFKSISYPLSALVHISSLESIGSRADIMT
jgi:hypothetical protein